MNIPMVTPMSPMNLIAQAVQRTLNNYQGPTVTHSFADSMAQYWRDVKDGKAIVPQEMVDSIVAIALQVLQTKADHALAEHGYMSESTHQQHHARHKRYKEVLEELRNMGCGASIHERVITEKFGPLTTEEKKVMNVEVAKPSKAQQARQAGMTVEQYCSVRDALIEKVK